MKGQLLDLDLISAIFMAMPLKGDDRVQAGWRVSVDQTDGARARRHRGPPPAVARTCNGAHARTPAKAPKLCLEPAMPVPLSVALPRTPSQPSPTVAVLPQPEKEPPEPLTARAVNDKVH